MFRVRLRFYEELNYFLADERKKHEFEVECELTRSVKDLIESIGVPHVEVDLILVNGVSRGFDYLIQNNDRISVYPVFESFDIAVIQEGGDPVERLRPGPLRHTRFVLDGHLGSLARKLRMLGFDTDHINQREDEELARISAAEQRILLTRDRQLLMRKQVTRGLYVRATDPDEQLAEIVKRLQLLGSIHPFTRCMRCNRTLSPLTPDDPNRERLLASVPPSVLDKQEQFHYCAACERIYWKGSHYETMCKTIELLRERCRETNSP